MKEKMRNIISIIFNNYLRFKGINDYHFIYFYPIAKTFRLTADTGLMNFKRITYERIITLDDRKNLTETDKKRNIVWKTMLLFSDITLQRRPIIII